MKLLTKKILKSLPPIGSQDGTKPPDQMTAYVKFFGGGRGTWFACEFDGDDTFFGYVISPIGPDGDEYGYFSLSDLQKLRLPPFGLPIERDRYFTPSRVADILHT